MFPRFSVFFVVLWCMCHDASAIPGVRTTEYFNYSTTLDSHGDYLLFWNFNNTHITFESHVRTRGWVGLGISDNGNMYPADVAVGWVLDNGTVTFSDRHTTNHVMPVMDQSQDWHLLFGEENEFGTVLKMVRKLRSCDQSDDKDVQEGTTRMIFAYGSNDPADEDSIGYHGTTRGTKSLSLLSAHKVPHSMGHVNSLDIRNSNYLVPSNSTTYSCRGIKVPPMGKHHVVKFGPLITPGNEMNVHHMLLYSCTVPNPDQYDGVQTSCYGVERYSKLPGCYHSIIAWAIGGKEFYFPENVGFPIGESGVGNLFILETHYDNPNNRADMIDDSGLRLTITSEFRHNEAGMLTIGQNTDPFQVVPPRENDFVSKGYCDSRCIDKGLSDAGLSEFSMFAAFQHAHLLADGIITHHYRNGTELKPLLQDPHYDFNFQETIMFPEEVRAYPGDSFRVDCHYDSTGRTGPTTGGLSTREEMCLTFVYYYPKLPVDFCLSSYLLENFPVLDNVGYYAKPYVWRNYLNQWDWSNDTVVNDFKTKYAKSTLSANCIGEDVMAASTLPFSPVESSQPYIPTPPDCP